ncbi:MAG: GGDEF domain-containing protein [Gemmatimonadota bacterium]
MNSGTYMSVMRTASDRWGEFWNPPDPTVQQAGRGGELVVAHVRLLLMAAILFVAVEGYFRDPIVDHRVLAEAAGTYLLMAFLFYLIVRSVQYRSWLGFASSAADVTIISISLASFLVVDHPHAAVSNPVLYPAYLLMIASTALRLDYRVCAVTGFLAISQYVAIVSYAAVKFDLYAPGHGASMYGTFNLGHQIVRAILIGVTSLIAVLAVRQGQRPQVLSSTDSLTGLLNRRAFTERLDGELARSSRYGRPISALMIDIDHFKQFNEMYGHLGGDVALQTVARTIHSRVREGDIVARYGGEEFIVTLPETGVESAMATAEQIRQAVAATPLVLENRTQHGHVTVSIGVASWPEGGQVLSKLLQRADASLYAAKKAGRDQVHGPGTRATRPRGGETSIAPKVL